MQFDKDLKSQHSRLFLQTREYLLSFDIVTETKKERITTYADKNGGICHMRTMSYGIDIGWLKGAAMADPNNNLKGNGKVMRVLPLMSFDKSLIEFFLKQAFLINKK